MFGVSIVGAVAAEVGEAEVVEQDHDDVRARRRPGAAARATTASDSACVRPIAPSKRSYSVITILLALWVNLLAGYVSEVWPRNR